jgi:hypothetical protein
MIRVLAFITLVAIAVAIFAACGSGGNSSTVTVTPASSEAGAWTISGQLVGSMNLTVSACQIGPPSGTTWGVQFAGTLNGTTIALALASKVGGTVDFTNASKGAILGVHYGAVGSATSDYWLATGGSAGVSGSVTFNSAGSGSMNVTLPPSLASANGAAQPIVISGHWVCPSTTAPAS